MMHDYSHFGAYYTVTETFNDPSDYRRGQPILYGSPRLHYIKCSDDVYYIRLAKDPEEKLLDIDTKGEFLCDFRLDAVDGQSLALTYMLTGNKDDFHPVTKQIVEMDEGSGLSLEDIINNRAGIMSKEFLGFVPEHVFMVRPDLNGFNEIEVEGELIKTPKFNSGNWYLIDNPEFL